MKLTMQERELIIKSLEEHQTMVNLDNTDIFLCMSLSQKFKVASVDSLRVKKEALEKAFTPEDRPDN